MAMQRFSEFFRRKNYSALWHNLLNRFYLVIKGAGQIFNLPRTDDFSRRGKVSSHLTAKQADHEYCDSCFSRQVNFTLIFN